jgi:hypothetical protein
MSNEKKIAPHHYHIWDLPTSVFPRKKGNKAKKYSQELVRLYSTLSFTNRKLQESSQIATFHIKSIKLKSGYYTSPKQVFAAVEDFVYHYENFCYRIFSFREKFLHFINEIVPVGFEKEHDVTIKNMMIVLKSVEPKLVTEVEKFSKKSALGQLIIDRNALTHKLYYGNTVDHFLRPIAPNLDSAEPQWFLTWRKEIETRSRRANKAIVDLTNLNHSTSKKIYDLKTGSKHTKTSPITT